MSNMTNHGYYVSFKRTDEEHKLENIENENKELRSKIEDLQYKFDELLDKFYKSNKNNY